MGLLGTNEESKNKKAEEEKVEKSEQEINNQELKIKTVSWIAKLEINTSQNMAARRRLLFL